jgi:hypothetical protein
LDSATVLKPEDFTSDNDVAFHPDHSSNALHPTNPVAHALDMGIRLTTLAICSEWRAVAD